MKIAFVGKGGSGKSTLSSLFVRSLQARFAGCGNQILAIDADLNMNLAGLLGVEMPREKLISSPHAAQDIRTRLMGDNPRIGGIDKFLPTTPPGRGSHLIRGADDAVLSPYAVRVCDDPAVRLLTVGTYDRDGIGQSCYHTNLFVAENILSHAVAGDGFDIVCDMVAGTDAFAYSLHLQFDAIILVAEPTPESSEVCALYMDLARESGIQSLVHLVGNKIADEDDLDYIRDRTGMNPLGFVPVMPALKKARQRQEPVTTAMAQALTPLMEAIDGAGRAPSITAQGRMEMLYALHEKLNRKAWVQQGYGDVMAQIDPDFTLLSSTQEAA